MRLQGIAFMGSSSFGDTPLIRDTVCLTVVILLFGLSPALGDPVPTWPLPEPHYTLESDRATYDLGENLDILFQISNAGDADLVYRLSCSPGIEIQIFREQELAWESATIHMPAFQDITILPGDSVGRCVMWDQTDRFGVEVEPGSFELRGVIHGNPHPLMMGVHYPELPSAQIQIVPEPSVVMLLSTIAMIRLKRRRNG